MDASVARARSTDTARFGGLFLAHSIHKLFDAENRLCNSVFHLLLSRGHLESAMWMNDWGWEDRQLFLAERRLEKARRKLFRERTVYQIVGVCVLYVLYRMVAS